MKTTLILSLSLSLSLPGWVLADPLVAPSSLGNRNFGGMRAATPVMETPSAAQAMTDVPRMKPADNPQPPPAAQPELDPTSQNKQKIPVQLLPVERQLELLHRQVEDLQRRLAQSEKRFAEHRHEYNTTNINQMNYRTLKSLLNNSDIRDGLLYFSSNPVKRGTSSPVSP